MRMNRWIRKNTFPLLLLVPHLAGMLLFYFVPFLWGVVQSFRTNAGYGLVNYVQLFNNEAFKLAAGNTLLFTLLTVPLLILISFSVALFAHRFVRKGSFVLHAFVINYAIPTASIAYIWTILFGNFGFVNAGLQQWFGVAAQNWLDGTLLLVPIMSLFLMKYAAYPIILFIGAMQSLPREIYEAAQVDGASGIKRLLHLTIPLLRPELLFVATLGFFFNFKLFKEAYALFGAYPPKSIYLVQHFMNNQFSRLNVELLTTSATVMAAVISLIIYILIRVNRSAYYES